MPSWSICKLFSYPGIAILAFMWQAHNPCCWITNWYLKYLIYIFKNISTTLRLYWLHCGNTVNKKNNKPAIWNLGTYNGCMWGNDIQIGNFYSIICQGKVSRFQVEPLVSLPSSDSLFPPSTNLHHGDDGSASATSLSPLPTDL